MNRVKRNYASSNRIGLTSLYDSQGEVAQAYHVSGVPKLVLIGKDGKIKRSRNLAGRAKMSCAPGCMLSSLAGNSKSTQNQAAVCRGTHFRSQKYI